MTRFIAALALVLPACLAAQGKRPSRPAAPCDTLRIVTYADSAGRLVEVGRNSALSPGLNAIDDTARAIAGRSRSKKGAKEGAPACTLYCLRGGRCTNDREQLLKLALIR